MKKFSDDGKELTVEYHKIKLTEFSLHLQRTDTYTFPYHSSDLEHTRLGSFPRFLSPLRLLAHFPKFLAR